MEECNNNEDCLSNNCSIGKCYPQEKTNPICNGYDEIYKKIFRWNLSDPTINEVCSDSVSKNFINEHKVV